MYHAKKQKIITWIVFGIYLLLLVWLVLFKFSTDFTELPHIRKINLIPFQESVIVNGQLRVSEIVYNILVFVPLGVYAGIFKPDWSWFKRMLSCLCFSFVLEVLQFILAIGASDITDLLANTLGGVAGIGICTLFEKIGKEKFVVVINGIGLIIAVFAGVMLGILWMANR